MTALANAAALYAGGQAVDRIYAGATLAWEAVADSLVLTGHGQTYAHPDTESEWSAYTGMWGQFVPGNESMTFDVSMEVHPSSFPAGTKFTWDVTPDPDWTGVNGYLHLSYGNYDDSPGTITPRQVYTISDLTTTVDWTFTGDNASGLLCEFWLTNAATPSGPPTRAYEVGYMPKVSTHAATWLAGLPAVGSGSFVSNGLTWNVREDLSGTGEPYYIAYRPSYANFEGGFRFHDYLAFLIGAGKITGLEWFNGLAVGVEPHSGAGSVTFDTFSVNYVGAARAPWTISNLTASAQSDTTVLLTWTPAVGATSHQYRVNGGTWTNTSTASSHTVTGLTASTAYTFEVRGVNATGNGAASNVANAATQAAGATNLIANGGFTTEDNWNGSWWSGKTIANGKANFADSPAYDGFWQSGLTLIPGKFYELTWTVSGRVSGSVYPQFTGGTTVNGVVRSSNGTFTERMQAATGNNTFQFQLETGGTLSVDDVSLVGPYDTAGGGGGGANVMALDYAGTGNAITTPHGSFPTAGCDVRFKGTIDAGTGTTQRLLDKVGFTVTFGQVWDRKLRLWWRHPGGFVNVSSSASVSAAFGTESSFRAVLQSDGGTGSTITFYESADWNPDADTGTWTQVGTPVNNAASPTFNMTGAGAYYVGRSATDTETMDGKVKYVSLRPVGGNKASEVISFDPTKVAASAARTPSSYTDAQGNVWSLTGTGWAWLYA